MRRRLDAELVRRGLVSSRARAAAAIREGSVLVSGAVADKPARLVGANEAVELVRRQRFVSRAGEKLDAALERFGIDVAGRRCLDAGASTGGFTDCLLQAGAASVTAFDVGRGQLDWGLRRDPRVDVREGVNVRTLTLDDVGGVPMDVLTVDLSFISLRVVAAALAGVAGPEADVVTLVKPQFEAGRDQVGRGGVVRDAAVHRDVLMRVIEDLQAAGLGVVGLTVSPVRGASGNVEFLAHARRCEPSVTAADVDRVLGDVEATVG